MSRKQTAASAVASALCLSILACRFLETQSPYIPDAYTPQPIANMLDGHGIAQRVAQEWDANTYLTETASVYSVQNGNPVLEYVHYTFVSGDKVTYLGVTVNASGAVEINGPALVKGSPVTTAPYSLEDNTVSEAEAFQIGGTKLGSSLEEGCGPVESVTIAGEAFGRLYQTWNIRYSGSKSILGVVSIHAGTGEVIYMDRNSNICP